MAFTDLAEGIYTEFAERQRLAPLNALALGLRFTCLRTRESTEASKQRTRLRAKRLKARGQCIACLKPAEATMCPGCTDRHNARRREKVQALKASGRCVVCRAPASGVRCGPCAEKHYARKAGTCQYCQAPTRGANRCAPCAAKALGISRRGMPRGQSRPAEAGEKVVNYG